MRNQYLLLRRKQIHLSAVFILFIRLVTIIYRVFAYEKINHCLQSYYFHLCGGVIAISALLLSLKWQWATYILSMLTIGSYLNIRFCDWESQASEDVAVLLDQFVLDFSTSIFLNLSWLPTIIGSILLKALSYEFFVVSKGCPYKEVVYPLCMG